MIARSGGAGNVHLLGKFRLHSCSGSNHRRIKSDRHRFILAEAIATDHKRGERSAKVMVEGNSRPSGVGMGLRPSNKAHPSHQDEGQRKEDRDAKYSETI